MDYVASWIILPLLVFGTSLGVGLLLERLTGIDLSNGLASAIGLAGSIVLLGFPYSLGLGATFGAITLVAFAVAGLLIGRHRLRAALPDWWVAAAALAVYILYLAPVALSGELTFAGYTLLGDTSVHFSLMDYVAEHGTNSVDAFPSSYSQVTNTELQYGYPLGQHFHLATLRPFLGTGIDSLYQPYLATTIALAATPAVHLLRTVGLPKALAAAAAIVVLGAYLPYSYSLQGSIKEMGMILLLLLAVVLAVEVLRSDRPLRLGILYGIVTAAAFQIYSFGGLPWFGLIGVGLLVGTYALRRERSRATLVAAGAAALVFLVAAAPAIKDAFEFFGQGSDLLTSSEGADVGNLLGPIRIWQAFGVWLVDDYRLPPDEPEWTYALVGVAAMLVLSGLVWSIRSRRVAPLFLLVPAFLVWLVLPAGLYIEAKLLTLLSPALVLTAVAGGWALFNGRHRIEAIVVSLALMIGVLWSDALAYHGLYLAPKPRLAELAEINERFDGDGPAMLAEFEEYGKHYLRDLDPIAPFDGWTPQRADLRKPAPTYAQHHDLDEMKLGFVQQFPLIVTRRSAAASRPPASYKRAYRGSYYEVWRRDGPFAAIDHLPLGDDRDPTGKPSCDAVTDLARTARRLGASVVAAKRAAPITFAVRRMGPLPRGWTVGPDKRVIPLGPGRMTRSFYAPTARYRIWLRGTFGRGASLRIDGRKVGHADQVQTPEQMSLAGELTISAGQHRLELTRGGGSFAPGNGRDEAYDRVFVEPVTEVTVRHVTPSTARGLCGQRFDWLEVATPAPLTAGQAPCLNVEAKPIDERALIRPRAGTFYAVDALNPDVVRTRGRLHLFFSGNSEPSQVGRWRTGLATATTPIGPFQIDHRAAAPFLNGGTIVQRGRFVQGYDRRTRRLPGFATSTDGRKWREFAQLPGDLTSEWNRFPSDLSLEPLENGFRAYFAGRPGRSGADIGDVEYRGSRFGRPMRLLSRAPGFWDGLDLGEPAVFEAFGRKYMLYGGLRFEREPRQIGLAVLTREGWRRCGDEPLIRAGGSWYPRSAVDPEPFVAAGNLYVFFAGGTTTSLGGDLDGTIGVRVYKLADLEPRQ